MVADSVDGVGAPPRLTRIVAALPASIPFVAPEALERRSGRPLTLRLGANESLFGPSPAAIRAIEASAQEPHLYGDPEAFGLIQALAAQHAVSAAHIVLGSGIDEVLGFIVRAYLEPGDIAVMSEGGYPTFAYHVLGHGGVLRRVPYRADQNDVEALLDAAHRHGAKLLYLANPDNPMGSVVSAAAQLSVLERLSAGCLLILDEAYAEFAPEGVLPSLAADDPRVVRLRTFSKAHGLAGLRIGYAIGAPALVRPFDRIRNQFGVGRLAQAAALASLGDPGHVASVVAAVIAGRQDYADLAEELGCVALPSATNFVAIDVGSGDRARAIVAALNQDEGVFIRMPGVAPLDRCIRVTIGPPEDRRRFAGALRRVLAKI